MDEVPEKLRVRFNETMNREARENMRQRHPVFSRYNVEQEEAAAEKVNEMLLNQFERNLPLGWVYIDGTWKLPEDLVADVIAYRTETRWFYALPPSKMPPPAKDMLDYLKEIGETPEIQQQQGRF